MLGLCSQVAIAHLSVPPTHGQWHVNCVHLLNDTVDVAAVYTHYAPLSRKVSGHKCCRLLRARAKPGVGCDE